VKSWSAEKIIKWNIALKLIGEEAKKQAEYFQPALQPRQKEHLIVFR
jgi:hypothetical protein